MDKTIALGARRPTSREAKIRAIGLAMCNAERKHHMLDEIARWNDLTDEAQEHYQRLAEAALEAITSEFRAVYVAQR